jgi:hypothetical protein
MNVRALKSVAKLPRLMNDNGPRIKVVSKGGKKSDDMVTKGLGGE